MCGSSPKYDRDNGMGGSSSSENYGSVQSSMEAASASSSVADVDDQRAARTASLRAGPLTENAVMREARKSSGTRPSGIIRKSLLSLLY